MRGRALNYTDFLASKRRRVPPVGRAVDASDVHPRLHDWQREFVVWAVRTGRAALWWDTGLGKTAAQIEWARLSGRRSLIVAPLAVCHQTIEEAAKLDTEIRYVRGGDQARGPGLWITNYEMVDRFDPSGVDAVVLDEASILKNHVGKTRTKLINHFAKVPYRLACTATPAPNDPAELTSQAEFLGVMRRPEMLASYFINDGKEWRLKHHGRQSMFHWMATWAAALRSPTDIGYPAGRYNLPPLRIRTHLVETQGLYVLRGVTGRAEMRAATVDDRVARAVELVKAEPDEPWLLWAGRNDEAEFLADAIPGAVNVYGTMAPEEKAELLLAFSRGEIQHLVTKPSIAGFGMNWQHCARTAFVGLSDSWEQYYQCIRRCWRYGQVRPVTAHIVLSDIESEIADNVNRKDREASSMISEMVAAMNHIRNGGAGT
jgi:helicase-like protein/SNF2 domain-containing protein